MALVRLRRKTMGEYECIDCNAVFFLEEPPFDGSSLCDDCRTVIKFPQLSEVDMEFEYFEREQKIIRDQAALIKIHLKDPLEYP
jgi:transcription initiation factor TFIIIB Brf1 subunit/transcription initiation factor TFIIB